MKNISAYRIGIVKLILLFLLQSCDLEKEKSPKDIVLRPTYEEAYNEPVEVSHVKTFLEANVEAQKDSLIVYKTYDRIMELPMVKALTDRIEYKTKGERGVSFMIRKFFNNDKNLYNIEVGDNSDSFRYVNYFNFILNRRTRELKAYEHVSGEVMSIKEWNRMED